MALRTFVDSNGTEWDAFDVVPRSDERRRYDRRTQAEQRADDDVRREAEERRENDRRLTVGGQSPLASGVREGWLCFERADDRRRLSPIPTDWQRCSDAELDAYCRLAVPARRSSASTEQLAKHEG
jgi:hypothetical protein